MAKVRPYHWQGRTDDGSVITKEEAGDGSDGDEEYKVWSNLVFILGSYEIFVLDVRLIVSQDPTRVKQVYRGEVVSCSQ